ncbi:hypothetical protein NP233_g1095 [Leucocoprinus birnbaumii]|uniref:Aconitase/3-isopropylmalate dehydratase large subunit alpha/beta/alpha domain-containing protein n=1 Tax=Leucocoprinus birnbaumii TaxID=56174 RepID=A0AAD5YV64_9AGAR|nr:hypothetical protein NP233_g1095 [Leucocoprinus birnbaumii]
MHPQNHLSQIKSSQAQATTVSFEQQLKSSNEPSRFEQALAILRPTSTVSGISRAYPPSSCHPTATDGFLAELATSPPIRHLFINAIGDFPLGKCQGDPDPLRSRNRQQHLYPQPNSAEFIEKCILPWPIWVTGSGVRAYITLNDVFHAPHVNFMHRSAGLAAIVNMGAEVGATTSTFPCTTNMCSCLQATHRGLVASAADKAAEASFLSADKGVEYNEVVEINLSQLEPTINGPFTPDLVTPLSKFCDFVKSQGQKDEVSASLIGSCTDSSYKDKLLSSFAIIYHQLAFLIRFCHPRMSNVRRYLVPVPDERVVRVALGVVGKALGRDSAHAAHLSNREADPEPEPELVMARARKTLENRWVDCNSFLSSEREDYGCTRSGEGARVELETCLLTPRGFSCRLQARSFAHQLQLDLGLTSRDLVPPSFCFLLCLPGFCTARLADVSWWQVQTRSGKRHGRPILIDPQRVNWDSLLRDAVTLEDSLDGSDETHERKTLKRDCSPAPWPDTEPDEVEADATTWASSRSHKKRRIHRDRQIQVSGMRVQPETRKAVLKASQPVPTPLISEELPATSCGYMAKPYRCAGGESSRLTLEALKAQDYEYIPWDGQEPRPFVDYKGRIVAVLAGHPPDNEFDSAARRAYHAIIREGRSAKFTPSELDHPRGQFPAVNVGLCIPHSGQAPVNKTAHSSMMDRLLQNKDLIRMANTHSMFLKLWAEALHDHILEKMNALYGHPDFSHLTRNFTKSVYPTAAINFGPQVQTTPHTDLQNAPYAWCSLQSFGRFDPKKGGHLVLKNLRYVIEFPPNSIILIPSATLIHANTPVQEGETHVSFTQYCPGNIIRFVDNGFMTQKMLELNDEIRFKEILAEKPLHMAKGLAMYTIYEEDNGIDTDRNDV